MLWPLFGEKCPAEDDDPETGACQSFINGPAQAISYRQDQGIQPDLQPELAQFLCKGLDERRLVLRCMGNKRIPPKISGHYSRFNTFRTSEHPTYGRPIFASVITR